MNREESYHEEVAEIFSEAAAVYDERIQANFLNRHVRRLELNELISVSTGMSDILEIGCGTSQEALNFVKNTGKRVTCIDISPGMISFSTGKFRGAGLSDHYSASVLPACRASELGREFDVVYSMNGALNTEPDLEQFFDSIMEITHVGSRVLLSFRNTFCLGEWLYFRIKGDRDLYRRKRGTYVDVPVVGRNVKSRYISLKELAKWMGDEFQIRKTKGLCFLFPPYTASFVRSGLIRKLVVAVETLASYLPFTGRLSDQIMVTAVRK
ncbi:MAG: class I SAM-dependent methyltransferase [Candidatus Thermoplasmatota archaeon]|nr:class I SAM-dependent methyltransferase [Candidatus Thermoplasmatota archaeon]